MKKKELEQVIDKYENALKEIQDVWRAPECLHTCRWGSKTIEICDAALSSGYPRRGEKNESR